MNPENKKVSEISETSSILLSLCIVASVLALVVLKIVLTTM
ncbi:MAG: hypothetical protein ACI8WT_004615 [Clostridium sp.]|jgi:hypothetical protein